MSPFEAARKLLAHEAQHLSLACVAARRPALACRAGFLPCPPHQPVNSSLLPSPAPCKHTAATPHPHCPHLPPPSPAATRWTSCSRTATSCRCWCRYAGGRRPPWAPRRAQPSATSWPLRTVQLDSIATPSVHHPLRVVRLIPHLPSPYLPPTLLHSSLPCAQENYLNNRPKLARDEAQRLRIIAKVRRAWVVWELVCLACRKRACPQGPRCPARLPACCHPAAGPHTAGPRTPTAPAGRRGYLRRRHGQPPRAAVPKLEPGALCRCAWGRGQGGEDRGPAAPLPRTFIPLLCSLLTASLMPTTPACLPACAPCPLQPSWALSTPPATCAAAARCWGSTHKSPTSHGGWCGMGAWAGWAGWAGCAVRGRVPHWASCRACCMQHPS